MINGHEYGHSRNKNKIEKKKVADLVCIEVKGCVAPVK